MWPDPTQPISWLTRPNPIQLTNLTVWCNQILSNRALNALTQSCQNFNTFAITDPTHPTKNWKISTQPNPIQPNATHGSTQPMDNSGLISSDCMNKFTQVLANVWVPWSPFNYFAPAGERSMIVMCTSVCMSACLRNYWFNLHLSCMSPTAAARSSFGGVAMRYILPVLWKTSYLHTMARNRRRKRCILKMTQQGAATV